MQILRYTNIQSIAEKNEMAKLDYLGWLLQGRGEDGGKQGVPRMEDLGHPCTHLSLLSH